MNKLLELRLRLSALLDEEQKILEQLVADKRAANEAEDKRLTDIDGEKVDVTKLIKRYEAQDESRKMLTASAEKDKALIPNGSITVTRNEGEDDKGEYKPFKNLGEQLQAVHRAALNPHMTDRKLQELNLRAAAGMSEGVGADGGFLVQTDFSTELFKIAMETGILSQYCTQFPVSAGRNGIEFPMVEETSRTNGNRFGGVQVYWADEAETVTKTKPKVSANRMVFQKLLGLCAVTDEMLEDASFLASFVSQAFGSEFGYKIDDGIINGTGAGQMLGIVKATDLLVTVAKENAQTADTIVGMNVIKMFARLPSGSMTRAIWLANQDCLPQLSTLTITKDKSDIPLYTFADGAARQSDSILGRPVKYIEQCKTLGDKGDLILADLGYYALIMRELLAASSIHVYFDTQQTAYRWSLRINGQPLIKKAITPANGSNTLSPFVTLEAR